MTFFERWVRFTLVLVYLVIAAGGIVRNTGSGMGCPDWPKCFGYLIPPTEASVLQWEPGKTFGKGQMIVHEEALYSSKTGFTTGETFSLDNWEPYTRHDYAVFNPWHTWIEYINRLLGALSGLAALVLAYLSLSFWKSFPKVTRISLAFLAGILFQAWLGATVVYSVLAPFRITLHMLMALVLVGMLTYLYHFFKHPIRLYEFDARTKNLSLLALVLLIAQVVMGTQVRQFVDESGLGFENTYEGNWMEIAPTVFFVHRSFSLLLLLTAGYLWWHIRRNRFKLPVIHWIAFLLIIETGTGIAMSYFDFPIASQPIHLVFSALLFGTLFYLVLRGYARNLSTAV